MAAPLPVVKAFLVCDQIIHDAQTGQKTLVGVVHQLRSDRFPVTHHTLWIYVNLTDARGAYTFDFRLVSLEEGEVIGARQPPPIQIQGPLQVTELSAQLRNVTLPRPGTYEFQLSANGELVATKAFQVVKVVPGTPPGAAPEDAAS